MNSNFEIIRQEQDAIVLISGLRICFLVADSEQIL